MALVRGVWGGAQIKGSIGPTTFQQSPFGLVARNRTKPVNPNTTRQSTVRNAMSSASYAWSNTLTGAQRSGWAEYAATTPTLNKFGDSIYLSGRLMFLRYNSAKLGLGGVLLEDAPLTPGVADNYGLTFAGNTTDGITIETASPVVAAGDAILVSISPPVSQARNYWRAPFSLATAVISSTTFPEVIRAAALVAIGQRFFVEWRTFLLNGKVSTRQRSSIDITA